MNRLHQLLIAAALCVNFTGVVFGQDKPAQQPRRPDPGSVDPVNPDVPPPAPPPRRPNRPGNPQAELRVPDNVQLVRDVVYAVVPAASGDGRNIELTMDTAFLKQSDGKPMPAIVYIHGGGWSGGSKEMGLRPSIALALGGYFAATIDYRLSGDAKYPAAVHDCKAAIRFLRANAKDLGIDPDRIGVWGHSAGGHLSALMGTTSNTDVLDGDVGKAPKSTSAAVQCVVDFSGPIDLANGVDPKDNGPVAVWLGGPVRTHQDLAKEASPTTYIDAKDPPTMIVHGTKDPLVKIEQSELFEKALKDAGVTVQLIKVEGAGHVFADPDAYRQAAAWFDKYLGGHAEGTVRELMRSIVQDRGREAGNRYPNAPPPRGPRAPQPGGDAPPGAAPSKPMDDHPAPG